MTPLLHDGRKHLRPAAPPQHPQSSHNSSRLQVKGCCSIVAFMAEFRSPWKIRERSWQHVEICMVQILAHLMTPQHRFYARSPSCLKRLVASSLTAREQLGSHWRDFHEISYLEILLKSVDKIRVWLKTGENIRHFTCRLQ